MQELLWRTFRLDISHNQHFSILGLACVCSYEEIRIVRAYGMELSSKECLFLIATFDSIARGECVIETADAEYPLDLYQAFRREIKLF